MFTTVRAKMRIRKIELYDSPKGGGQVTLSAVYSGDKNSEDNTFSQATPSAELTMMVTNPPAFDFFKKVWEEEKKVYLDFSVAETS